VDVAPHPALPDCVVIRPRAPPTRLDLLPEFVVVDAGCAEAVLRGSDVFAPGVLGSGGRFPDGQAVSVLAHVRPETLNRGRFLESAAQYIHIANGVTAMERTALFSRSEGLAIRITDRLFPHPSLNALPRGLFLQTIPSMYVAHLLRPSPGSRVLDMCAAPGGKATHLAAMIAGHPGSEVVALDRSATRLRQVVALAEGLGVGAVLTALHLDATKALGRFGPASFDYVLLDPPCSGLGLRPRLRPQTATLPAIVAFADYQRKLLATAAALLRPGGTLAYSTCTLTTHEFFRFS